MLSSTDGWIVGFQPGPVLLHWNGLEWSAVKSHIKEGLNSIFMLSPEDGWMVGGLLEGRIFRWDGSAWSQVSYPLENNPDISLYDIYFVSSNDGWIVGSIHEENVWKGLVLHWDGSTWTRISLPTETPLSSIYMLSSDEGWIVGGRAWGGIIDNRPTLMHSSVILYWDGMKWTEIESPVKGEMLHSIHMLSSNKGWAVGTNGAIIHWNGESWSKVESPIENRLFDIHMLSPTEGWAVGMDGVILRYTTEAFPHSSLFFLIAAIFITALIVFTLKRHLTGKPRMETPEEFKW
jgi:photosystem II stability/assembly factor-like uncharacterized protein